jgi:cyclopropane-fatty-acyl-phospholipid synthase
MNRSRLEPLGVPGTDYQYKGPYEQPSGGTEPKGLDRWLVQQLMNRLDPSRVQVVLWDTPETVQGDVPVTVRVSDRKALLQLVTYPELHFGDLYSAGRITVQGDLLTVLDEAYRYVEGNKTRAVWLKKGPRLAAPSLPESRKNIHHHYDIGNEFYKLWLDRDALQYTCAYFADRDLTIELAQQAKMHHVCR